MMNHLIDSGLKQWERLTQPAPSITDPERRRAARFAASVTLSFAMIVILLLPLIILSSIFLVNIQENWGIRLSITAFSIILLLAGYALSRRGLYRLAHILIITLSTAAILLTNLVVSSPELIILEYLAVPILYASLFYRLRELLVLLVTQMAGMLLLARFIPEFTLEEMLVRPISFNLVMASTIFLLTRHIHRREMQQQALIFESKEKYRLVTETAKELILTHGLEGRLTYVNPAMAQATGYSPEEMINMSIGTLVPSDEAMQKRQERRLSGDSSLFFYEALLTHKDGSKIPVEISSTMLTRQAHLPEVLIVGRNITERKRAAAERLELALERERATMFKHFVDDISHDLKTPLTVIKTNLYLLAKANNQADREQRMAQMHTQIDHLKKMIDDMLVMSSLDDLQHHIAPDLCPYDLNKLIADLFEEYQPVARLDDRHLLFEPSPAVPVALFDREMLRRALGNLIHNALKYTSAGETVTVRTRRVDPELWIEVDDTGPGIAPNDLPHIFNRFYRGAAHRPSDGGTGLGLPIAQRLIEAHDGHIDVESSPGKGTLFRVVLPCRLPQPEAEERIKDGHD